MKSYLIKNKKYTFMIIFLFLLFFTFDKVYAVDLKTSVYFNGLNDNRQTGTLTNSSEVWKEIVFTNDFSLNNYNYDYVIFRLREINFTNQSATLVDSDTNTRCTYWAVDLQGNNANYRCNSTASDTLQDYQYVPFDVSVSAFVSDPSGTGMTCIFDDTLKDHIICPITRDNYTIHKLTFIMQGLTSSNNANVSYAIRLDKTIYFGNKESTEIIKALSNLGTIQQNTTTTIQNFNNYVSNTSTTQAQTNQTTALSGLTNTFNSHLSQMNELTQLVFMPINFIITISSDTCQPLIWDIPFVNSRVVVPCMSTIYQGYFGLLVGTFSTIISGLLCYRCCLKLFNTFKGILDAEDDKIEVIDL